jgi:HSP20 family protein
MTNRMNNDPSNTSQAGANRNAGSTSQSQGQSQGSNQSLTTRDQSRGLARQGYSYGMGYSPFDMMRRFSEDVDRLFGSFGFGNLGWPFESGYESGRMPANQGTSMASRNWTPPVDVFARGDDLVIDAELPGIKPEDVTIEAEGNNLIVRGESNLERNDQGYYERSYGSFYRTIPLPQGVNADNAQFNNGVLEITLPGAAKQLQPQRRRIAIQGAQSGQSANAPTTPAGSSQMNTSQQGTQGTSNTPSQSSHGSSSING